MINRFKDIIYTILFKEKVIISSDESLKDKVIIITGASKGIGKSTTEILLKKGARVVAIARDINNLKNYFSPSESPLLLSGDITSEIICNKIIEEATKKFGKIDVLINNAGIFKGGNLENVSEKDWDSSLGTNLKGVFLMSKAVIPVMKKNKAGLIINIGSKISHNTNVDPGKVIYASTKYAVEGFSLALSRELMSFGIRVTCIMPGTVNTFRSLDAGKYLSPYRLGEIISNLIKYDDVHFESIILKSVKQNI